jgi:hypothetical protein
MSEFLPKGYEVPKAPSDYMKFEDGKNKFRILSAPLMGYMYWTNDKKPVRQPEPFKGVPEDAKLEEGKFKPKHFWALVVWNYQDARIQILELTQASIQGPIQDLAANEDWGDPREYDITVSKSGKLLDTEYSVIPSPKTAVPTDAHAAYREARINLEALYEGKDPFNTPSGSEGGDAKDVVQDGEVPFSTDER